jgi:hypothetical protein
LRRQSKAVSKEALIYLYFLSWYGLVPANALTELRHDRLKPCLLAQANEQIPGDMITELLLRFFGEERAQDRWTISARCVCSLLEVVSYDCCGI